MAQIDQFLRLMVQQKGSDLHLTCGSPPILRLHGELTRIKFRELSPQDMQALFYEIMTPEQRAEFEAKHDLDFAYEIPDVARFRVNLFRQRKGIGAVLRTIPSKVLSADELGLPEAVRNFCELNKGLVLVTGPTGSGKSTTLAAMVDLINETRADHVLTIEDPIEFVHQNKRGLVNQREIGNHTASFSAALRAALREDPDVILVGEMRDLETISLGITAAETGHLVFGTLHTNSAAKTVDRIINAFPADEQEQIRAMLAETLRGVVSQQLLRRADGHGRVAALEILVGTPAIANLIREGKTFQIPNMMQTGRKDGMQLMDQAILDLLMKNVITPEEAYTKAHNKAEFAPYLDGAKSARPPGAPAMAAK
ncbi:MAG: type IV pilus twitching motility protein PilT [Gemmatimonadetes bacterium]|nr:type IV pilus twitching motility protein PilT [Gemmatimonadota bacterium]